MKGLALLLPLLAASSCRKDPEQDPDGFALRIVIPAPAETRVAGAGMGEAQVQDLQVLVFDRDGALETSGHATAPSLSLTCRGGDKTVWAFVNAPAVGGVTRLGDLDNVVSRLGDNAPGRLVMSGSRQLSVHGDRTDSVAVERLCAKVSIDRITRAFSSGILQDKLLILNRIYMTNVAADRPLTSDGTPASWLNKMGNRGEAPDLLCDTVGKELRSSLEETHTFYVYPNGATSGARGGTWSPRPTRLVLDTTLDGDRYYYVIDIPDIRSNHTYRLTDVVLNRPGATDEEQVSAEAAVHFSLTVAGWGSMAPYGENL